jgi:beta-glucanase (GH16 family)
MKGEESMFRYEQKILTRTKMKIRELSFMMFFVILGSLSEEIFAQDYKLVWSDEFNGTALDTSKWGYQFGNQHGWGNNEKEYYRTENAVVKDGFLNIIAKKENYNDCEYTSSRILTRGKGDWKYGKFEMRAKMPKGKGIWPAFWMMPTQSVYGEWPVSGEIDIMEYLGHETNIIHGTLHYGDLPPNNKYVGKADTLANGNFCDDFHIFSLTWEENKIEWFVDGELYHSLTSWNTMAAPYPAPFDQKFHIILNLAVGGYWPGMPDESTVFPQEYIIDYVRVYQKAEDVKKSRE